MKKIQSLNLSSLRIEEDFGFMKLISAETALLTADDAVKPAVTAFTAAWTAFDDALKDSASVPSSASAAAADEQRDAAWRGTRAYVRAMTQHPAAATAAVATETLTLVDKYGDPTALPQTEETGVLHNLLQDLAALPAEKATAMALAPWTAHLKACQDVFEAAVKERTAEESARTIGVVKEKRQATDEAYRKLADLVNALCLVNGEAGYTTFIDHVNTLIDRQKTVLKARSAANARKAEAVKKMKAGE